MRGPSRKRTLALVAAASALLLCAVLVALHAHVYAIPRDRLAAGATYPDMPPDRSHHYLDLPVDHGDPSRGQFRGFYLLSPHFRAGDNVTFVLTDGQMELVGTRTDFAFFEDLLGQASYVLLGVRGHAPTLLPEVYPDGKVDYAAAFRLYGSDQQVEDIEAVRRDMAGKGLLGADAKINVFGASGAGVLAQQYVSTHGAHVKRILLESTGAPDLALQQGLAHSPDFAEFNPQAARALDAYLATHPSHRAAVCTVLYQQGRSERQPRDAQRRTIDDLRNGGWLLKYQLTPRNNLALLAYLVEAPKSLMARVRWFELVGADLLRYDGNARTNLLYEMSSQVISDVLAYHRQQRIPPKRFQIDRSFPGPVLILKGTRDSVFGDEISERLRDAYPNATLRYFDDGHRLQADADRYRRIRQDFLEQGLEPE